MIVFDMLFSDTFTIETFSAMSTREDSPLAKRTGVMHGDRLLRGGGGPPVTGDILPVAGIRKRETSAKILTAAVDRFGLLLRRRMYLG